MKILHLMPYSPVPPNFGGAIRTYNILKSIVEENEVTVVLFGKQSDKEELKRAFPAISEIYVIPGPWQNRFKRLGQLYSTFNLHSYFQMCVVNNRMQSLLNEIFESAKYDIVQTEFSHLSAYVLNTKAKKIIDAHNVEYDNYRRMWINGHNLLRKAYYFLEYKKLKREEIEGCRNYDAMLVTSARDKSIFERDLSAIPKYIVPNGVDSSYFTPGEEAVEPFSMVFSGMMAYVPNYDGMYYFLDEIFPLIRSEIPGARIYIVGNRPPRQLVQRASENVVVTGYTDDVRPYIRRANVYVVPLRMGSGTRLKITEALSMKKPVVTTSIGCEGINVVSGESAMIADSAQEFADAVIQLMKDPGLRRKLVDNGYRLMQTSYDWPVVGKEIRRIYRELAGK